jgi:hypothetical protein
MVAQSVHQLKIFFSEPAKIASGKGACPYIHGSDDYPVISAKSWEDIFLGASYILHKTTGRSHGIKSQVMMMPLEGTRSCKNMGHYDDVHLPAQMRPLLHKRL